ncbi:MAG: MFS transporter [Dehalococcoidales bacterium]
MRGFFRPVQKSIERGVRHTLRHHSTNNDNDRKSKNNLLRFHGDAASSAVEEAAINYQSPSIIAAGANAQSVSILATMVNLCLSLVCIKAPALIERLGQTKRGAVILSFLNLLVWVPLILAFLLSNMGITPVWLAMLWLVNVMPGILLSFQRDNWMSNIVPPQTLGRYLGQRLAIKSAFYLGAFCLLGFMLDAQGEKSLISFAFIFIIALVMSAFDFVIFTHMHEPVKKEPVKPAPEPPVIKFGLFSYIKELKEKKLNLFIGFTSLFYLTVGLTGPLYAVYMLEEKHFTYLSFTVIIATEYLARVVSAPFWGKYADKKGNIKVLGIVSRIIPAVPIAWLFCSNIGYLAAVQMISGICWGAFDLSTQSYLYKVAPPAKKLKYIVYTRCLILLSTAVGGLIGAYLVDGVFMIFGSRLLTIFMISGFFRAVVVMYLIPKLVDLAVSYGKPKSPPKVEMAVPGTPVTSRRGLFYQQQELAEEQVNSPVIEYNAVKLSADLEAMRQHNRLLEERLAKAQTAKEEILALSKNLRRSQRRTWVTEKLIQPNIIKQEAVMPAKSVLNTTRRNWAAAATPAKEKKVSDRPVVSKSSRRPWFGDSEIAAAYTARTAEPVLLMPKKDMGRTGAGNGLYHDNAGWTNYLRETMQSVMRENRDLKAVPDIKPAPIVSTVPARVCRPEKLPFQGKLPELVKVPVYLR